MRREWKWIETMLLAMTLGGMPACTKSTGTMSGSESESNSEAETVTPRPVRDRLM